jgi:hypothetical protein
MNLSEDSQTLKSARRRTISAITNVNFTPLGNPPGAWESFAVVNLSRDPQAFLIRVYEKFGELSASAKPPELSEAFGFIASGRRLVASRDPEMATRPAIFKWPQTEPVLTLCVVRWYLRYSLSLRDVEELLDERGWQPIVRESMATSIGAVVPADEKHLFK